MTSATLNRSNSVPKAAAIAGTASRAIACAMRASRAVTALSWAHAVDTVCRRPPCLPRLARRRPALAIQAGLAPLAATSSSARTSLVQAMVSAPLANVLVGLATPGIHATSPSSLASTGVAPMGHALATPIPIASAMTAGLASAARSSACSVRTIATTTGRAWMACALVTHPTKVRAAKA